MVLNLNGMGSVGLYGMGSVCLYGIGSVGLYGMGSGGLYGMGSVGLYGMGSEGQYGMGSYMVLALYGLSPVKLNTVSTYTKDLQIFSLTLSQLSYMGVHSAVYQ